MREPVVIAPEGEVGVTSGREFYTALAEAAGRAADRLVVDLTRVSFLDSTGLSALIEIHNRFRREQRKLAVVVPAGTAVAVLINLMGLTGRLPVFETREAALRH